MSRKVTSVNSTAAATTTVAAALYSRLGLKFSGHRSVCNVDDDGALHDRPKLESWFIPLAYFNLLGLEEYKYMKSASILNLRRLILDATLNITSYIEMKVKRTH
ncbi:unnamed protein product [Diplocarpon coronariae]